MESEDTVQFVRLVWRDNTIQAEDIDSSDIPQRYREYEFLAILLEWMVNAKPGDSMNVMQERILRYR